MDRDDRFGEQGRKANNQLGMCRDGFQELEANNPNLLKISQFYRTKGGQVTTSEKEP